MALRRSKPMLAAVLLLCAAHAMGRKPSRRRLENDIDFEKKGRVLHEKASLFRAYDESWETAASDRAFTQTEMDIECIRHNGKTSGRDGGKGYGKGGSKSKKSKKSRISKRYCSDKFDNPSAENAPVSAPVASAITTPVSFPSSENNDNPSAESAPVSSPLESTTPAPVAFPSSDSDFNPTAEFAPVSTSFAPSAPTPVVFPSESFVPTPVASTVPSAPSLEVNFAPTSPEPSLNFGTSPPTTDENGDDITNENFSTVCEAFFDGTAPTSGPEVQFEAKLSLLLDGSVPTEIVLIDIHEILTSEVAPAILGCPRLNIEDSGRKAEELVSVLRNVVFAVPVENASGLANVDGSVYYTGPYPEGILDMLEIAIQNADFLGIPGLVGFGIIFEIRDTNDNAPPIDAPSESTVDDGIVGAVGSEGNTRESGEPFRGYVGVAIAGMVAALVLILAARASTRRRKVEWHLKHQKLEDISTDDESNPYSQSDFDTSPDDGEDLLWLAHVVNEEDSGIVSWDNQATSTASNRYMSKDEGLQFEETHSPDSTLRRATPQIRFVPYESPSRSSSRHRKEYLVPDTYFL